MTGLASIGVVVEGAPREGGLGDSLQAVLSEVARMLDELAAGGRDSAIDLRSLPMSPADRSRLLRILGDGEVQAVLDADGLSHVRETAVAGVWWVEHRDRAGTVRAESLDVAWVPAILSPASDEVTAGARALREQLVASPAAMTAMKDDHDAT